MKEGYGKSFAFSLWPSSHTWIFGDFNINPSAHPANSFFFESFLPCLSEKPYILHYPFQPGPACYKLPDRSQAISRSYGDSRPNEIFRNFLGNGQNRGCGLVLFWRHDNVYTWNQKNGDARYYDNQHSFGKDLEIILNFHVRSKRHRIPLIRFIELAQGRTKKDRFP